MTAFKKGRRKTGGRKKSTPNKISSMLISAEWRTAIFEHFKDHKQEVLDLLLKEFPNKYAEIMAGFAAREQQLAANNPLMGEQRGDPIHVIERIIIDPKQRAHDGIVEKDDPIAKIASVLIAPKVIDAAPEPVPQIEDMRNKSEG